jgi:hypothetical protein
VGKLVSIKTGKELGGQDYIENDDLVAKKGQYIGVLPKEDADYVRMLQEKMTAQQIEINERIEAFDLQRKYYIEDVISILLHFEILPEDFNPATEDLYIGEDGHTWIVKKGEDK